MRCALILTLLAGALLGQDVPMPEETASMLLAKDADVRERGMTLLDRDLGRDYERKVLKLVARWAGDRAGWVEDLEARARTAGGAELARIQAMLGHLAGAKGVLVETRVAFVALPTGSVRELLGAGSPTVVFGRKEAWDRWGHVRSNKHGELLFERAITTQDTRPAAFAHGSKVSYVAGYEHDQARGTISPEVKSIETGIRMQWTPHLSVDGGFVTLDGEIRVDHLKRPIAKAELTLAGRKLQYEKPELERVTLRQAITLPVGGCAAWRLEDPAAKPGDRAIVVLVYAAIKG